MRTIKVITGTEKSRGASMMLSKGTVLAELKKSKEVLPSETKIDFEEKFSPCPIDRVDKYLYIGNRIGAEYLEYLKNNEITHIVNTTVEIPNYHEKIFKYVNIPLQDNPVKNEENLLGVLEPTYQKVDKIIQQDKNAKIFVHCAAGISRSASIVIYYLMKKYSLSYDDAFNNLKKVREIVNPNDWYKMQLRDAQLQIESERGIVL